MQSNNIGPKIKQFRKKQGLTQEQFANSLGYSGKSAIAHIEKGDADMTYEKILLFLRTYMLDANEFFEVEKIDKKLEEHKIDQRKNKKVAIYIHGLHGSHDEAEDYFFLKDEYDVVGLEYQDGNPWELKEHIRKQFEKLSNNYKEVVVIANSIGAFYTYEYLSDFNIKQAFFISPIASMFQIIFNMLMSHGITRKELEQKGLIKCDDGMTFSYDFYRNSDHFGENWSTPTEILYGSHDELVYIENIADFLADHPNSRLTIKRGAEHYFHTQEEKDFIKEWILRNIK